MSMSLLRERVLKLASTHQKMMHTIIELKYKAPSLEDMRTPPLSNVPSKLLPGQVPPPPNVIPDEMLADYTMQSDVPVLYWYLDERGFGVTPAHNTKDTYESIFQGMNEGNFFYYEDEGKAFFDANARYPLKDKEVTIWGLAACNCEAFAAWASASKVLVVEYNKPLCEHSKIIVYNHEEYTAISPKTDFAISYSSFEHDGLGRYGDPLAPNGDLRAMEQARNGLEDNGIMFFGVPLGPDSLVWNAHRIYGKRRLPMLLRGWKLLDVFNVYGEETPEFPFDIALGEHRKQCLMVLKKIATDWPTDEYLLCPKEQTLNTTCSAGVYNRINKMIFDYKHQYSKEDV